MQRGLCPLLSLSSREIVTRREWSMPFQNFSLDGETNSKITFRFISGLRRSHEINDPLYKSNNRPAVETN